MDSLAHFPCYPCTTGLGAVVTNGLPCTFSLPPCPGIGVRGCKWIALHLFPAIPALLRSCTFFMLSPPIFMIGAVVTNGLPCTFSLILPSYPGVGDRGCKWIALHLFPAIPDLLRGGGPWLQMDCPASFPSCPRPTQWLQMECPALFPCYPGPIPGLRVVTNGLSCTFFLLSPPYAGVGGHDYKWIALHHQLDITALTRFSAGHLSPIIPTPTTSYPMFGAVVLNGMPCKLSLLFSPYHGFVGRDYKWITLQLLPAIPALHRSGVVVINGLSCTFSLLSPPNPGLRAVVANGMPCTFSLLSPSYYGF